MNTGGKKTPTLVTTDYTLFWSELARGWSVLETAESRSRTFTLLTPLTRHMADIFLSMLSAADGGDTDSSFDGGDSDPENWLPSRPVVPRSPPPYKRSLKPAALAIIKRGADGRALFTEDTDAVRFFCAFAPFHPWSIA